MRVKAYRNLHAPKGTVLYSLMDRKTRRVIARSSNVLLENVEFRVNEPGRQRVLREKVKNVHAFVVGDWEKSKAVPGGDWQEIYYNPYAVSTFVLASDRKTPVLFADAVVLTGENGRSVMRALNPRSNLRSNPIGGGEIGRGTLWAILGGSLLGMYLLSRSNQTSSKASSKPETGLLVPTTFAYGQVTSIEGQPLYGPLTVEMKEFEDEVTMVGLELGKEASKTGCIKAPFDYVLSYSFDAFATSPSRSEVLGTVPDCAREWFGKNSYVLTKRPTQACEIQVRVSSAPVQSLS